MSTTIRLLVVEDDEEQYETYCDTAEELKNGDSGLIRKTNSQDAQSALLSNDFDAAIVDLNLDATDSTEASGNDILGEIIGLHRFPVFVVSGNLGKLNEGIREKESMFLKCYDRDKPNKEIFHEIQNICGTGITRILGGRGLIEQKLAEIFWNHLAGDLDVWLTSKKSLEKALLRYTVSHLSEYLDMPSEEMEYYSEAEFYIKPPIRKTIATGDIVEKDSGRYIVLSPACDVAIRGEDDKGNPVITANRLTLAKLIKVDRNNFLEKNIITEENNTKSRESALKKIIHGQRDKYIFLPKYKELDASVVDLQNLYTISFDQYRKSYRRIATIAGPFLKDIQSRFSSYYGRQGQPDLNKDDLLKKHKNDLSGNG
jgi:hypothetical protein